MGSKSRRIIRKRRNRGGERLQEWTVLKQFNLVQPKNIISDSDSVTVGAKEGEITPHHDELMDLVIDSGTNEQCHDDTEQICGRRIVDFVFFIDQLKQLSNHCPQFGCSLTNITYLKEIKQGLRSGFVFRCEMCGLKDTVWSEPRKGLKMDINSAAVAGAMNAGGGHANLSKILGSMDIRCMSFKTYQKHHDIISKGWEATALKEMKLAAEEEIALARQRGDVDQQGVPLLTVVADGSWAKRSYRINYNSLSGMAAIVGYHTRKVLYFGVKNKYCVICARSSQRGLDKPPHHACFKNWGGSLSSMESTAIVEGFLLSEEMYGVKYSKLIADGDSSVYCKIIESRPYDDMTVEKIECRNHLLRNYCNKLREIATTTLKECDLKKGEGNCRSLHLKMRRVVGSRILRCRAAVKKAILHRKSEAGSIAEKSPKLRKDIINGPSHVFGEHGRCKEIGYFCDGKLKEGEYNYVEDMKKCGVYQSVMKAVDVLADFCYHLVQDVDSNIVENYNSIIAMFTGGKRTNLIQRNSHQSRCAAAVVSYNSRRPFYALHKSVTKESPGCYAKLYEARAKTKAEKGLERRKNTPKARRCLKMSSSGPNKDYGPNAQKPDMDEHLFAKKVEEHIKRLKKSDKEIFCLQESTVNQSQSLQWHDERRVRLTASNFGLICKRKPSSKCGPVVSYLLYRQVNCAATKYGKDHEDEAIQSVEKLLGLKIKKCGLFVDKNNPWIAASPDGLVGDDAIVEVKCPSSGEKCTPEDLIMEKKSLAGTFWLKNKTNGSIQVNRRHSYFYQIQGQLQVTQRNYCHFAVWTQLGLKVETIVKDDGFWAREMLPKLEKFYFNSLLPELIDPRRRRNMSIREPASTLD